VTVEELLDGGFQPINWCELEQLAQPNPVIPDLLNEGESGSLISQAGEGKSLLMLDVTVALALGKSVLGTPPRDPITVMYIDMENPQDELGQRLRSMGCVPPI
jgi:RecA-family ATPase